MNQQDKPIKSFSNQLQHNLENWANTFIEYLPNFILALLCLIFFVFVAKYASKLLRKILNKTKAQESIKVISSKILRISIILIGFFIALGILDLNKVLTTVLGAAGVISLVIGLALQGTLHNTFAGLILSFLPKIQIGDWIQTADQNMVIIPNAKIIDSDFKNYSRTPRGRISITCGVGYESDLDFVQKITTQAVEKEFPQRAMESIQFYYTGFENSSIDYILWFWSDVRDQRDVYEGRHRAILAIKKAYNKNDINIPFPIRTLDFGKNKFRSETIRVNSINEDS